MKFSCHTIAKGVSAFFSVGDVMAEVYAVRSMLFSDNTLFQRTMNLTIVLLLLVTVFAVMHGTIHIMGFFGGNLWVMLDGGTWTPATGMIPAIRDGMERFAKSQAAVGGLEFPARRNYTFRYRGESDSSGRRYVFISASCESDDPLRKSGKWPVMVNEAAACGFTIRYDPHTGDFSEFTFNGGC